MKQEAPLIISTPEITVTHVEGDDCFFVLACDGIWVRILECTCEGFRMDDLTPFFVT